MIVEIFYIQNRSQGRKFMGAWFNLSFNEGFIIYIEKIRTFRRGVQKEPHPPLSLLQSIDIFLSM
jgi:hypothetical protein